jgi:putative phosphoribosyl transferase
VEREICLTAGEATLAGTLTLPDGATGIVLCAHGCGSSRHSPRNRFVASSLQRAGLGTLLMDLLTREEEAVDAESGHLRFDIELLAERVVGATGWLRTQEETKPLKVGYFGASTGAGAALVAASKLPHRVKAIVSRGGRPDLAGSALLHVEAPTLLIVGGHDFPVITLNEQAFAQFRCAKEIDIVPGASHLFEEPGALEEVARLAADWFNRHLG